MKKIKFSKLEKRVIIVLMLINFLALFVNVFGVTVTVLDKRSYTRDITKYYLFTDVGELEIAQTGYERAKKRYPKTSYESFTSDFYPFVYFYFESKKEKRFRGIFTCFDHTEFILYTLLIIGIPVIRKIW